MLIREATHTDAEQLRLLLLQLSDKYVMTHKQIQNRITAFKKDLHQLLVVEIKGKIVGVIAFGCYEYFRLEGRCCHIDTLVIEENFRGKGIGKTLITIAENFAKEHDCVAVELNSSNERKVKGTHSFYINLGYQDQNTLNYTSFIKK